MEVMGLVLGWLYLGVLSSYIQKYLLIVMYCGLLLFTRKVNFFEHMIVCSAIKV